MANTLIDLDDEALEQARRYYGTSTKKDTVNRALQDAAARLRERRNAFGDHLEQAFAEYTAMSPAEQQDFTEHLRTTQELLEETPRLDVAWERRRREWAA
jgi:Arc/MetJ family transcription regulator